MTEAVWLTATDPEPMLEFLRGKASGRKLRLFAVSCCHRISGLILDERSQQAVAVAEEFAEGLTTEDDIDEVREMAELVVGDWEFGEGSEDSREAAYSALYPDALEAADFTSSCSVKAVGGWGSDADSQQLRESERCSQSHELRDIFGNPFRPVALDPVWHTSTVLALAEGIYADRAFCRMPILADAMQDAGCDHPDILAHCRGDGPHVRGCWVIDLVLGKS